MDFRKSGGRAAVIALALALGACATPGSITPESPEDAKRAQLVERAEARGMALVRGDLDAAYDFMSEGSKAVISKDNFKRRMSVVPFRAYRIDEAGCEGATCRVKSRLTYDHRLMKGVTTPMTEAWVIEHGKVFYVFPAD